MEQKKILVVDDEENLRLSFQKILQHEGFSVKTASNGVEALKIIKGWAPDLILTDQNMPGMKGLELVEEIHKIQQAFKVPCLLMSGKEQIVVYGLDGFLFKPIFKEALLAAVRELIK